MGKELLYTEYAPAERDEKNIIQEKYEMFLKKPEIATIANSIPDIFLILNDKRQAVYANQRMLELLQTKDILSILGKRPGEILNCIHSSESEGRCGTTEFCSICGAANAIMKSLAGNTSVEECRIITENNEALDLRVWATPYYNEGDIYSIFAVQDISGEKRRNQLEKIFFHDIMNTAGGIYGISQVIRDFPEEATDFKDMLFEVSESLIDEINAQKQLLAAESGELGVSISEIKSSDILNSVYNIYSKHIVADNKFLMIDEFSEDILFSSDYALIKRIIGNLVKNALEASKEGQTVSFGSQKVIENIRFWVHNDSVMPKETQLQLFQRSFSTKGQGRGLGSYSVKLLTEKYLGGKVNFISNKENGTTFYVSFNLQEKTE